MKNPVYPLQIPYYQQTLRDSFTCIGVGLHTGLKVIMTVMPGEANSGYRFVRRDIASDRNEILAAWHTVSDTHLCTTVRNKMGVRVSTVEHLIAALHACGVDNARIVLDGPEVPIMDGSAAPFVQLIESVGVKQLAEERKVIVVKNRVKVVDGEKEASFTPSLVPHIALYIDFESRAIGRQFMSLQVNVENFKHQIANARTFGFAGQLSTLKKLGFARGGSLHNAVLVSDHGVVNGDGLRYENEFVRHKILDCIGDLALAGSHILGFYRAKYTGHKLNNNLLHELLRNPNAYEYLSMREVAARCVIPSDQDAVQVCQR